MADGMATMRPGRVSLSSSHRAPSACALDITNAVSVQPPPIAQNLAWGPQLVRALSPAPYNSEP
jgi:hypothetical protein